MRFVPSIPKITIQTSITVIDMRRRSITISEFLESFPIPPLHHMEPPGDFTTPWVFWNGSEENRAMMMIHEKIVSSFSSTMKRTAMARGGYMCQFWAPVLGGSGRLLSTSGQPFAVGGYLSNEFAMYRQYSSENHNYNMDVIGGAFVNRLSSVNQLQWIPSSEDVHTGLHVSITLPVICLASQTNTCIGVMECTSDANLVADLVLDVIVNLKEAGLDVFPTQHLIPYKTINGLELAKDEIDNTLKVVCHSHNVALAQVWIACEDKSCMKETRQQVLARKLSACVFDVRYTFIDTLCDALPSILALTTLKDYKSRFVAELRSDLLIGLDGTFFPESRAATICLKNNDTGDFVDYVFEFIWTRGLNFFISLTGILSTLKKCLPRFKYASGEQIYEEEIHIMFVGKTTTKFSPNRMVRLLAMPEENLDGGSEISRKIRKANDSSSISQINTCETLTLEADYGYGIIKFNLPISQATYANIEKKISNKLGLSYDRLEYLDEEEDWICFDTEEEMGNCIRSSRILAEEMGDCLRIQLRVTLSHKSVIGPFGMLSIE